jgi:hypothetical protein
MTIWHTAFAVPSLLFHPEIVPSRVEKRNEALVPLGKRRPVVEPPDVTDPAGNPVPVPDAGGTMTLNEIAPVEAGTT